MTSLFDAADAARRDRLRALGWAHVGDIRTGHAPSCSRHPGEPPACTCTHWLQGHEDDFHGNSCPVVAWRNKETP